LLLDEPKNHRGNDDEDRAGQVGGSVAWLVWGTVFAVMEGDKDLVVGLARSLDLLPELVLVVDVDLCHARRRVVGALAEDSTLNLRLGRLDVDDALDTTKITVDFCHILQLLAITSLKIKLEQTEVESTKKQTL
jgi:hypothetical protein